jgi:hypothetical protein
MLLLVDIVQLPCPVPFDLTSRILWNFRMRCPQKNVRKKKRTEIEKKEKKKGAGNLEQCNMSGGAGKRAKRGEKGPAAEAGQAVLNAMIAGDGKALHEAMYLLPQRLPNVASSGQSVLAPPLAQVGEKRSLQPDNEAKLQKSAKSAAARAALRAVERAIYCVNSNGYQMDAVKQQQQSSITGLKRQLDEMDKDQTVKTEEYDDVINDMKLLATNYKKEAFGK